MPTTVLALNTGSSSLKFACYGPREVLLYQGSVTRIGQTSGTFVVQDAHKQTLSLVQAAFPSIHHACDAMFEWIATQNEGFHFHCVGHRVVHGGPKYSSAQPIDDVVLADIEKLATYAPEHIPPALTAIAYARTKYPLVTHVAAFDTAFHRT
jgi:acetate kinase